MFTALLAIINYFGDSFDFLKNKKLIYIGKLSYGCYVYHYPLILLFKNRLDSIFIKFFDNFIIVHLLRDILLLLLTILVSHLSFKLFESKFLKLKQKFTYN